MIAKHELIQKVDRLTPFSSAVGQTIRLLNDPDSDIAEVTAALRYDPSITAQILKLCNSAAFGVRRQVASLKDAVVLLGRKKVSEILLLVSSAQVLDGTQNGYGLQRGMLWQHSVAVALAAEALGQRLKIDDQGVLFTAGLLHDIGKLVLSEYVGPAFRNIVDRVKASGQTFSEAEKVLLGFSHAEVGAMLAERWKLPEPIVRCIRFHYEPSAVEPADRLVDCVYLADCIGLMLGAGVGSDGLLYKADPAVMQRIGVRRADLAAVQLDVALRLRDLTPLFSQSRVAAPVGV